MSDQTTPPGWYPAPGDPPGTQRYWDGSQWTGSPVPVDPSAPPPSPAGYGGPGGLNLASPWMRILARVIDGILVGLVFSAVAISVIDPDDFDRF